ncbi:MAG: hypothetical protein Q8Q59_12590 [Luteolibacter sp.]|jgi:hypothetical protein|nr:hypothetical protein [Luteolibacter sp.]
MNRDQLKEALTGMGVSFANNASTEKLQALYDEALAAKAAGGNPPAGDAPDAPPPAAPDAPKKTEASGEIPEDEIIAKTRAGLSRAQAIEVITAQREHDKQLAKMG